MFSLMNERLTLHCVDGDSRVRAELARIGFSLGHHAEVYGSLADLVAHPPRDGIIIARDSPGLGGIARFMERAMDHGIWLPVVATDSYPSTTRIVAAMKAGAIDYVALPIDEQKFAVTLERIGEEARQQTATRRRMLEARGRISSLSNREREVLDWLTEGSSNKVIARELEISPRTVEIHRANMMSKLGARHAAEAVRLRLEAQIDSAVIH